MEMGDTRWWWWWRWRWWW